MEKPVKRPPAGFAEAAMWGGERQQADHWSTHAQRAMPRETRRAMALLRGRCELLCECAHVARRTLRGTSDVAS